VSKCWKQEKSNWREIALFQPKPAQSGCTGQCPVVHQTVSGAPGWLLRTRCSREFNLRRTAIIHRTVRCAPDCPVSQRSAARSTRDTWPSQRSGGGTGLSGVHRTVSGAPTAPRRQRSATPQKERNPHRTVSGVHRTVRCARLQKARIAFLECTQRLLAALGL
jgi:hypothetical protein